MTEGLQQPQERIVLMWTLQAQFSGYALARRERPGIELIPRPADTTPIREVAAGRAEFGIASPSHMLAAGVAGREMLLAALIMPRSPIVAVARRGSRGETLAGATGLRIGVWASEDSEIRAMLVQAGADPEANDFIPIGDQVEPIVTGELDLIQATTYNEVPLIERAGLPAEEMVLHCPADYGVDTAKDGLVVSRRLADEQPDLVHGLVDAVVRGWRAALEDPAAAVAAICELAPDLDAADQRAQLERVFSLIDPDRPLGRPLPEDVERAVHVHRLLGRQVTSDDIGILDHDWDAVGA
jgi:NitT/TauT family transport system substrate-binding protein